MGGDRRGAGAGGRAGATPGASPPRGRAARGPERPALARALAAAQARARRSPTGRLIAAARSTRSGGEGPLPIAAAEALAAGPIPDGRAAPRSRGVSPTPRPTVRARLCDAIARMPEGGPLAGGADPRARRDDRGARRRRLGGARARRRRRARRAGRGRATTTPRPWPPTRAPRWPRAAGRRSAAESWVGAACARATARPSPAAGSTVSVASVGDGLGGDGRRGRRRACPGRLRARRAARPGAAAAGASDRAPIAAPVLEARDHRGDRERQVAGHDAVAEVDGQRLARQRRARRRATWAAVERIGAAAPAARRSRRRARRRCRPSPARRTRSG